MKKCLQDNAMKSIFINNIKGMRKVNKLSALFFSGLIILFSCKKSGELIPTNSTSDLNAIFTDTTTVKSFSLFNDSLRTDETSRSIFGVFNDPVFGTTVATNFIQFNLSTAQLQFPSGTIIDSVVLKIAFEYAYGNFESYVTMNVRELNELLDFDKNYGNNSYAALKPEVLGSTKFKPDFSDTTTTDTNITGPHASITLDVTFGESILNHGLFEGNADFLDFFKGLALVPDTTNLPTVGDGNLTTFNLLSENSRIRIYYNSPLDDNTRKYSTYDLVVSAGTPRFSNFRHKFKGTTVSMDIEAGNDVVNYVQPLGGVRTKIIFPNLTKFLKSGRSVINKAELVITAADGSLDTYAPPAALTLITEDEEGNAYFLPDFFEGSNYFGGRFDINTDTYKFNIARYIDQIVNEDVEQDGLYLLVSGSSVSANRLILNGGASEKNAIKLKLTYTQL